MSQPEVKPQAIEAQPARSASLTVLVALYFWSPAHWAPPSTGAVEQHTGGTNSPAEYGAGNTVIINGKP